MLQYLLNLLDRHLYVVVLRNRERNEQSEIH